MARRRKERKVKAAEPDAPLFDVTPAPVNPEDHGHMASVSLLGLTSIKGIGYRSVYNVAKAGIPFWSLLRPDEAMLEVLTRIGFKQSKSIFESPAQTEQILTAGRQALDSLHRKGIRILHSFEADFPAQLKTINNPPHWLFVEGNPALLNRKSIAIVGTRTPDAFGLFLTQCVTFAMSGSDLCTVSGLAEGIDRETHLASIDAGLPTVAILGTGINQQYPASSADLRKSIVSKGGCVISEYLPDDPPDRKSFVWRNRLQAGLSTATIPTQWKIKSGTAHTVNFAIENGRPVIGVRLPFQADGDETAFLKKSGMEQFVLPNESEDFRNHLLTITE